MTTFRAAIWAATWKASSGNLLARIDPATGRIDLLPSDPMGYLVEGGKSGLWGRWDPGAGTLGVARFDTVTERVEASAAMDRGSQPIALAVASDSVWVATYEEGVTRVELRPA
jgi:streptogramin lyase